MPEPILCIAGARPNFTKIAPLMKALKASKRLRPILVHTGQHYDRRMSELFFQQLNIPDPDVNLGVGSGSHAAQTAAIMSAFEPVVLNFRPAAVLVVGDVNSTIACSLVAAKLGVRVVHVEAGLRSFDRTMPEEINRVLTDAISDYLFCTEQAAVQNLLREGIAPEKIFLVGNVMIDTLLGNLEKAQGSPILDELGLEPNRYAVLTLHRPSNVEDPAALKGLLAAVEVIQRETVVVFPVHPRTRKNLATWGLDQLLQGLPNVRLTEPAGYLDFLKLLSCARAVLTDSGGIQEETTILKVPCLTLRHNTERPITVEIGSNRIVGTDPKNILAAWSDLTQGLFPAAKVPPLWDGKAAWRIAQILDEKL
jgi:UDP-N-acetylglucosamine 2-epimerase (non-hydrolysing)